MPKRMERSLKVRKILDGTKSSALSKEAFDRSIKKESAESYSRSTDEILFFMNLSFQIVSKPISFDSVF